MRLKAPEPDRRSRGIGWHINFLKIVSYPLIAHEPKKIPLALSSTLWLNACANKRMDGPPPGGSWVFRRSHAPITRRRTAESGYMPTLMDRLFRHVRHRLISGVLLLIPVGISLFVLSVVYRLTVGLVSTAVRPLFRDLPVFAVIAISLVALAALLYGLGALTTNMVGRQLVQHLESLIARIPVIDSVYGTAKQLVELFRANPDTSRRTAVLVPFPHPGTRAMGFLTGTVTLPDGTAMCTVFIPTTPNPTTGFLQLFPVADILTLEADTDEAFQFIMSAGIMRPAVLTRDNPTP